jgi:small subunit ribosomal protein S12
MVTYSQYLANHRRTKQFRSSTPHFEGSPFKYGICVRVGIVKPKKPNSAQRKIAKVRLSNDRLLIAYIPGFGHKLVKNSEVMVRGGRVPDLPGVRYHILRGKKDLQTLEINPRSSRRSKYGIKNPNKRGRPLSTRAENKIKRRAYLKTRNIIDKDIFNSRLLRIQQNILLKIKQYTNVISRL